VTVLYRGDTALPVNAGHYPVTFQVAEGQTFTAASNLDYGTLIISQSYYPLQVSDASLYRGGNTVDLKDFASCPEGTMTFAISGSALGCSLTQTGMFTSGSTAGSVTVTVSLPASENRKPTAKHLTVTVLEKRDAGAGIGQGSEMTKLLGDSPFSLTGTVTDPGGGGVWTWSSGNADVAEVDPQSGLVTIVGKGTVVLTAAYESDSTAGSASLTLTVTEMAPPSVTVDGTTLRYSFTLPDTDKTVFVLAAWYDSRGRMVGIEVREVTGRGETCGTIPVDADQAVYKLFLMDSEGAPLCRNWSSGD
jgi:hypothetical protein